MQGACDVAVNATIAHVGEQLLHQQAILLPDVHDFFLQQQNQILMANEIIWNSQKHLPHFLILYCLKMK